MDAQQIEQLTGLLRANDRAGACALLTATMNSFYGLTSLRGNLPLDVGQGAAARSSAVGLVLQPAVGSVWRAGRPV